MAVKIRLKRMGKIRAPFYRVVVADSRKKRDGAVIEEIGKYHPTEEPSVIEIDSERAQYWLGVGAQPTEQVAALLKVTGDWAKFSGEGDSAGSLKSAEAKKSAEELIAEADKAASESREGAKKAKAEEEAEKAAADSDEESSDVEPGSEEAPAEGESAEDADAASTDEA
ncbi:MULTISPECIES: 30S ribosomal protein S16 [unclassified Brachybacterium]|uniref:30S ribosomal protein S16 n=1 Tax=unclassified Brachybacterium TaxID=2623841 RepID=UPI000C80B0DF|nr:30S ribosomal protein S16 [Brachybacterium sp. UMB0905]PMC75071.1 30S ribosomal protein S16 [Brachybacterium sp. UMB0905]